ncbi:hypothetical protein JCM1841_005352 [Sporobolomyces salmonicolor]
MFRTPLFLVLAALSSLTAAQLPANAPDCATRCFATKITEAGSLAPGVAGTDIAGLCAVPNFVQAYYNCLSDHCTPADLATAVTLGQQVCASAGGSVVSSGITGSVTTVLSTLSPIPASTGSVTGSVASEFSSLVSASSYYPSATANSTTAGVPISTSASSALSTSASSALSTASSAGSSSVLSTASSAVSTASTSLHSTSASSAHTSASGASGAAVSATHHAAGTSVSVSTASLLALVGACITLLC